jgi:lipopolysaccharide transport system ATP-binding protein
VPHAIAITCQGVSKSFALIDRGNAWRVALGLDGGLPRFQALRNVSFDVPKGQFVGVLGRNGAGKSTLLRIIGGVYSADTGRISINGAMSGLYELGLVANPQLTGRQYADRLLKVHGFATRERAAMSADIHDFSELGDRFDDPVQTYSAGMGARLYFATATAGHYDVYLLDEVLAVGDQHFQSKCWRRIRERVSGGASGILVTHDWSAILRLCETAHVLDYGQVLYSGPAERAVRRYLYGEDKGQEFRAGIARFLGKPSFPAVIKPGADFVLQAEVEICRPIEVFVTFVVERLEPGFGWETALMSRRPTLVGNTAGRHLIEVLIPETPLEPGSYQGCLHLVIPGEHTNGPSILLDGFSWLNGTGLSVEVVGEATRGLTLPLRWAGVH